MLLFTLIVVLGSGGGGRGAQASTDAARTRPLSASAAPTGQASALRPGARVGSAVKGGACRPVGLGSGYVNPTAGATLMSERIDQGVDYAGTGVLTALGAARVTYVGRSGTGWPGAFVEYRLLDGPDAGCFVYYAEGITPVAGLRPGETIRAGQTVARIIPGWPTGIEIGWGAGQSTKTEAAATERWTPGKDAEDVATAAGRSFSALIAGLGGPAGRVEG